MDLQSVSMGRERASLYVSLSGTRWDAYSDKLLAEDSSKHELIRLEASLKANQTPCAESGVQQYVAIANAGDQALIGSPTNCEPPRSIGVRIGPSPVVALCRVGLRDSMKCRIATAQIRSAIGPLTAAASPSSASSSVFTNPLAPVSVESRRAGVLPALVPPLPLLVSARIPREPIARQRRRQLIQFAGSRAAIRVLIINQVLRSS